MSVSQYLGLLILLQKSSMAINYRAVYYTKINRMAVHLFFVSWWFVKVGTAKKRPNPINKIGSFNQNALKEWHKFTQNKYFSVRALDLFFSRFCLKSFWLPSGQKNFLRDLLETFLQFHLLLLLSPKLKLKY